MSEELSFLVTRASCVLRDCIDGSASECDAIAAIRTAMSRANAERHAGGGCMELDAWYAALSAALPSDVPGKRSLWSAQTALAKLARVAAAAERSRRLAFAE